MTGDERIALLKDLCDQATRLRDDAEALCQQLTKQIERTRSRQHGIQVHGRVDRRKASAKPPAVERRKAMRR